ncbi:MAG: hypothetical protein SGPRY_009787, partial [Prymnesium sp.]
RREELMGARSFMFESLQLRPPLGLGHGALGVLGLLCKLPPFISSMGRLELLHLLSVTHHTPRLTKLALAITTDLVRRSSEALIHLIDSAGLLLVIQQLFEQPAHPNPNPNTNPNLNPTIDPDPNTKLTPNDTDNSARIAAFRALSAMISDSLHGAQVADMVCRLLTPRFRLHFENKPEAFLAFFDGEHSSGTREHGNERVWNATTRKLLHHHITSESDRLLLEYGVITDSSANDEGHSNAHIIESSLLPILAGLEALWGSNFEESPMTTSGREDPIEHMQMTSPPDGTSEPDEAAHEPSAVVQF